MFIDVSRAMADENGQPCGELFQADGVHMNAAGYKLWAARLRPHLRLQASQPETRIHVLQGSGTRS